MRFLLKKEQVLGSGFSDEDYVAAGAKIVDTADEAWSHGNGHEGERAASK